MSPKEYYLCVVTNDTLRKADAIILLEGDGFSRVGEAVRLFKDGWAPRIVISGGLNKPPHAIPASELLPAVLAEGVPEESVLLEPVSQNTREQGIEVMKLVKQNAWKVLLVVASHYHQYRAYLTFLKAMKDTELEIVIINAPARNLSWFSEGEEPSRITRLEDEFNKIERYRTEGHAASFAEALEYQEWKESQV